jgi:hypothetical protein
MEFDRIESLPSSFPSTSRSQPEELNDRQNEGEGRRGIGATLVHTGKRWMARG